ncbi:MAG: hypothetical protein WCT20_04345 [Candidatus Babeliales bacterium]|jgi:hypothetical protein
MVAAVQSYLTTFFESARKFWQDFDLRKWSEGIGGSSADAIMAVVYFILSFAAGVLCRKYFKYIFICCIFTFFTIKGLEFLKIIYVDWRAVRYVTGMVTGGNFFETLFLWIKMHLLLFVASTVGFLVGYKLG